MIISYLLLAAVLGLCIGSFVAARVFDIVHSKPNNPWSSSRCHSCTQKISFPYIIPMLGYFLSHGRCRNCKIPIWKYFWRIELLFAVLFGITSYFISIPTTLKEAILLLSLFIFISMLCYIALIDIFLRAFPVRGLMIAYAIILALRGILIQSVPFDAIFGSLSLGGILLLLYHLTKLIYKREALGTGDIYVATFIGAGLGLAHGLISLYLTFILGGLVGVFYLVIRQGKANTEIPFAPLLAAGAILSLFFAPYILTWYLSFL